MVQTIEHLKAGIKDGGFVPLAVAHDDVASADLVVRNPRQVQSNPVAGADLLRRLMERLYGPNSYRTAARFDHQFVVDLE